MTGRSGNKDNVPTQEEQGGGDTTKQGTPMKQLHKMQGHPNRSIIHIGGPHKKAKAHKDIPKYTITKDDVDLVAERVQDHVVEEYEEVENQRERIMKELVMLNRS
jgi:hypothetical protein